jgi:hypothetical protein
LPADISLSTGRQGAGTETGWGGSGLGGDPRSAGGRPAAPGAPASPTAADPGTGALAEQRPLRAGGLRGLDVTV